VSVYGFPVFLSADRSAPRWADRSSGQQGQLASGVRATPGSVGYLGSTGALTVLNAGDALPGGWSATWDGPSLIIAGNSVTIDHYRINAEIVFTGTNPTVTNSKIYSQSDALYGVTVAGSGKGVLTVTDTTVIGNLGGTNPQVNGISSESGLRAIRCDVSQTGDGIHINAQAASADAKVSQCYVHNQRFTDEAQHCDGNQVFAFTSAGQFLFEHNYIAATFSTIGTPMNSALTLGQPTNDTTPIVTATIDDNYFAGGLYHLRVNNRTLNSITNNDFGALDVQDFGYVDVGSGSSLVSAWSNNRDEHGSLIT
jgi:hypothetical protein